VSTSLGLWLIVSALGVAIKLTATLTTIVLGGGRFLLLSVSGNTHSLHKKGYNQMSTYSLPDLLHQWAQGNLTADQAVGHVLQNLPLLLQRLTDLDKRVRQLEQPHPEGTRKTK